MSAHTLRSLRRPLLTGLFLLLTAALIEAQAQEVVEYYAVDTLGSVRVVFDVAGAVSARSDYLPFGEAWAPSGNLPAQRFTGQQRDAEEGWDHFNARNLNVRLGRFNRQDPISGSPSAPQRWNRYSYVLNNPLRFVDPSGAFTVSVSTNCRQEQGAYWCPGQLFLPDPFRPDSVDMLFDTGRQGYRGGEELAMAEAQYEASVSDQFFQQYEQSRTPTAGAPQADITTAPVNHSYDPQGGDASPNPETGVCAGPEHGCRAVSFHPGQAPVYVTEAAYNDVQRLQGYLIAASLAAVSAGIAAEVQALTLAARTYPNAGGGGIILFQAGRRLISIDWHRIPTRWGNISIPHIDVPGVVKHWPWPRR